jgi:hypothetical protein
MLALPSSMEFCFLRIVIFGARDSVIATAAAQPKAAVID